MLNASSVYDCSNFEGILNIVVSGTKYKASVKKLLYLIESYSDLENITNYQSSTSMKTINHG